MVREVIFDIETRKLFDQIEDRNDLKLLGVSVVSAYRRGLDDGGSEVEGQMKSFWPADAEAVARLGPSNLEELEEWFVGADRVVGFNSLKFDVPVLAPHFKRDIFKLPHFDLLDQVKRSLGFRVSLNALAKETLGETKLADGLQAVDWWNAGDEESLKKLRQYCEKDVLVTKQIYDRGLAEGKLKFKDKWNEVREFVVNFAYPKKVDEPQLGLF